MGLVEKRRFYATHHSEGRERLRGEPMKFEAFLKTFDPHTPVLGIVRSLLALSLLGTLLCNDIDLVINPLGFTKAPLPGLSDIHNLSLFSLLQNHLWLAKALSIFILMAVASGFYSKFTTILHAWVALSFANSCSLIDGGGQINGILTLLIIPLCLTDPRKNHYFQSIGNQSAYTALAAYLSLLAAKLQMCFIYFHAAVGKIPVDEWSDGTALYYWFQNNIFGVPSPLLEWLQPILTSDIVVFATWGVLVFEFVLAASITSERAFRLPIMVLGIFFHLGIAYIHGLTSFFITMAAGLILYLGPITTKELRYMRACFAERNFKPFKEI